MKKILITLLVFISIQLNAQWNEEWTSSTKSSLFTAGWISIHSTADQSYNFYIVDDQSFMISQNPTSESPLYSYSFTAEEVSAGNQIYSVGADLTGDDVVEFYVLAYHDSQDNPRQSFKLIDITNGNVLFEKNNSGSFYTYPVIWDVDNDGQLECTYAVYDYPNFTGYSYSVIDTGVPTSLSRVVEQVSSFELMQNYPNPFNPATTIRFYTKKPGNIRVNIYNTNGQLINRIKDEFMSSGSHKVDWNGTNENGGRVSSGTYFYSMDDGSMTKTKKMMIIK